MGRSQRESNFIVFIGLESPPVLIGMNIMRPFRVRIDVTPRYCHACTAGPADHSSQRCPDAGSHPPPPTASRALLLQAVDIPAETARPVLCHNPWPNEDVYFCPEEGLPTFVSGVTALTSGSEVWVAIHNHRPEPLRLHIGQTVGTLEIIAIADSPPPPTASSPHRQPPVHAQLSPTQHQQLKALFQEFSDVISQGEDDLGCTPLLQHTIETEGPPLCQPYRRQNPAVRREEMAQVQQMLSSCVIRPSNSPWASPVVMVKKKDGSLRFCLDFRQLNMATVKDAHPIPCIDDLLNALHGARWFSTLDLKSGYWQAHIQEWDKEKTAFRTSSGQLFEFNQVPFGLCKAPATFSRLMDRILAGLHCETCLFYLDDIIVFATTWEEHLARLQVFEHLQHAQLKLGADKCTFAAKEVSYLGHWVTEEGLLPNPFLLATIREISPTRNTTEVCSSLGLARYYRRYVKNFASSCAYQERCGLPMGYGLPGCLRSPQDSPHNQPYHCLPRLQPAIPVIYRRVYSRPRHNPRASKEGHEAHHLLRLALPQTSRKSVSRHQIGVPRHRLGRREVPTLPDVNAFRGLHRPLRAAMAKNDAHRICPPRKLQTHVDILSRLPADPPPSEDATLQVRLLDNEDEARKIARELPTATHLGGHAL